MTGRTATRPLRHLRALVSAASAREVPDAELVARFADRGDEAAFEALLRRHGAMVLRVCRRVLGHAQDAEDAFQATFLVLAKKAGSLRRRQAVAGWLYGVALRVAGKARARAARQRAGEGQAAERFAPDPLAEVSVREAQDILDDELLRLPEKYQAPLLLCCLEGWARDEAAARLGLPLSTLKSRLEEGRDRLRRRLARRGLSLSVALSAALLSVTSAAAVPPRLLAAAVRSATAPAGAPSALARAVLASLPGARLRLAALVLAAAGLLTAGLTLHPFAAATGQAPMPPSGKAAAGAPEPREPQKVDQLGDPLPPGARLRLGTLRHQVAAHFQLLPDGKTVVTVRGNRLCRMDVGSGAVRSSWPLPAGQSLCGIAPDGKQVVLADEAAVSLWDAEQGKRTRPLSLKPAGVWEVPLAARQRVPHIALFSPDGRYVAGASYLAHAYRVWLWSAADGRLLWEAESGRNDPFRNFRAAMELPSGSPHLSFLPDSKSLALLDDRQHVLQVRDCATGKERGRCGSLNPGTSYHWTLSPDGKSLLAVNPRDGLRVHDLKTGEPDFRVTPLRGEAKARYLQFTGDGKTLLIPTVDGKLRVLDWPSGKLRRAIDLHGRGVKALLPARDGRTAHVVLADEWTLRSFDLQTGRETTPAREGHRGIVSELALAPDGKVVSAGYDGSVQVWDLARGRLEHAFRPKNGCIFSALSGDGKRVAAVDWERTEVAVHDRDTGRLVRTIELGKPPRYLAFAPNSRLLLTGEEIPARVFRVWDADTGREVRRLEGEVYNRPAFSADGRLLAATASDRLRLLDFRSGKELFSVPEKGRHGLAFTWDGRTLACGDHKSIALWEVLTGRLRGRIELPGNGCTALQFSPDGRWLAWGEGERVRLWDRARGRLLRTFAGHEGNVTDLRFTPDGRSLISASTDSTLLVWDLASSAARPGPPR
jgi:RNA polymerase sigma factor (sigma-70 family)